MVGMLHDKSTFKKSFPYSFRNIPARLEAKFGCLNTLSLAVIAGMTLNK